MLVEADLILQLLWDPPQMALQGEGGIWEEHLLQVGPQAPGLYAVYLCTVYLCTYCLVHSKYPGEPDA